jgi:hypothetical protein
MSELKSFNAIDALKTHRRDQFIGKLAITIGLYSIFDIAFLHNAHTLSSFPPTPFITILPTLE